MKMPLTALSGLFLAAFSIMAADSAIAADEAKIADGVRAVLKADPSKSMLDLYLSDAKTGKEITDAKVKATVTLPDGTKVEKELMGMKMGKAFSFMNTLDMGKKGAYVFEITVDQGKKSVRFVFERRL